VHYNAPKGSFRVFFDNQKQFITSSYAGLRNSNITALPDHLDDPLCIGKWGGTYNNNYFEGIIDEVAIYNKALSPEEIRANMYRKLTSDEPNLVGYWNFDKGEGQVAADSSGNGNNGTIGFTSGLDDSDPQWVISDAPVGICNTVAVDIKPGSCPNPLNLNSKGLLSVAILGSQDFDINTIDPGSIFLDDVPTIRTSYEDVTGPLAEPNECECTTAGAYGLTDLVLKFKNQEIVEKLLEKTGGELDKGQTLELTLTGQLHDGSAISGTDCVVLVGNVPKWLAAKVSDLNDDGIINVHDLAIIANYWLESSQP